MDFELICVTTATQYLSLLIYKVILKHQEKKTISHESSSIEAVVRGSSFYFVTGYKRQCDHLNDRVITQTKALGFSVYYITSFEAKVLQKVKV